jgi:outer membrane protein assembly factor BamB
MQVHSKTSSSLPNELPFRSKSWGIASGLWAISLIAATSASLATADDWPQWMGLDRDGIYREAGIVERIPDEGLPIRWRVPIAGGYAGPAVADGRVFVTDYVATSGTSTNNPGARDRLTGQERVLCFDVASGKPLWEFAYDRTYNLSYANGPRATPTVDGDRVYVLGAEGDLLCLESATGKLVWKKQLAEEYHVESPIWGHAAHPLVHGDLLYCLAGGSGSVVVAMDKLTGEVMWQALSASEIGYCPPTIRQLGNRQQLLIWDADALHGLDPSTGKLFWTYPLKPGYGMAIAAPQVRGDRLFASGIGEKAVMMDFQPDGTPGDVLWEGKPKIGVYSSTAPALFDGMAIYGADCGGGKFIAVNASDGARFWETFALTTGGDELSTTAGNRRASSGTAFVVKHEDKFILFAETGELIFARFAPSGYTELGRMQILEATSDGPNNRKVVWSHPAFADRCVFARNDKELVCVSLAAE